MRLFKIMIEKMKVLYPVILLKKKACYFESIPDFDMNIKEKDLVDAIFMG
ncbi:hypothetical protein [Clostridium perfringens]|uniref:Uncharacterized protein n=2 Tax=Clostridium perfringens TaxID=1502 RepID=A0AAP7BWT1_CLOPF|nr:hypothetical protein [Clostridium perfringens]NGU31535.1 hypothetical protein [Clostridium perfringens]